MTLWATGETSGENLHWWRHSFSRFYTWHNYKKNQQNSVFALRSWMGKWWSKSLIHSCIPSLIYNLIIQYLFNIYIMAWTVLTASERAGNQTDPLAHILSLDSNFPQKDLWPLDLFSWVWICQWLSWQEMVAHSNNVILGKCLNKVFEEVTGSI